MGDYEFDTVKVEEENVITKYGRVPIIGNLFILIEVISILTLISWSSMRLPSAVNLSRKYLLEYSTYLFNPHIVFVIGNFIVISLYVISRHFDCAESDSVSVSYGVAIDHNTAIISDHKSSLPEPKSVEEERSAEEKQIVGFENETEKVECEAVAVVIENATKRIQRFQRAQSEKLKREISVEPRRELRRSKTEIRRRGDVSPNHRGRRALLSFDKVDRLSNEEFRLAVEAFIEKQQSFLKSQKLVESN